MKSIEWKLNLNDLYMKHNTDHAFVYFSVLSQLYTVNVNILITTRNVLIYNYLVRKPEKPLFKICKFKFFRKQNFKITGNKTCIII